MRYTLIKSKSTAESFDLGGDVGIICDVMEMGKYVCDLVYEVDMSGEELIAFLKKHRVSTDIIEKITVSDNYTVSAFDW